MKSNKNIVLIGMMGSGKSSIGKILSKKLKLTFIDIDKKIEEFEDLKISEIFNQHGEYYFRKIEEKISLKFLSSENSVISLGGGTFLNKNVRNEILKNHNSFWLKWNYETILKRVQNNPKRPIAFNLTNFELMKLIKKRSIIYSKALYSINCDGLSKKQIVNKIKKIHESD